MPSEQMSRVAAASQFHSAPSFLPLGGEKANPCPPVNGRQGAQGLRAERASTAPGLGNIRPVVEGERQADTNATHTHTGGPRMQLRSSTLHQAFCPRAEQKANPLPTISCNGRRGPKECGRSVQAQLQGWADRWKASGRQTKTRLHTRTPRASPEYLEVGV